MESHKKINVLSIPETRDPFINTPLIPAGFDPDTGEERFWISTWNGNLGCLGALITPGGKSRVYRLKKYKFGWAGCGGYSAVLEDNDTLWLISDLACFVRLTLSTGEYGFYKTGAVSALVFSGAQYDPETGTVIAVAYTGERLDGVCFSLKERKTIRVYNDFTDARVGRGGFDNKDGTYMLWCHPVRSSLIRWDPKSGELREFRKIDGRASCVSVIYDDDNRPYIPYHGWLDVSSGSFRKTPCPERETIWFSRIGEHAFGVSDDGSEVYRWDLSDGKVTKIADIPDGTRHGITMTKSGDILAVNLYGEVYRVSREGRLLSHWVLDGNSTGAVDCLVKIDGRRILGTPFITQRFWVLDATTDKGFDGGRAAAGFGEVTRVWNINGKVYMASYTNGMLTEFDPDKKISFPENPRIITTPPNAMRPVASADDGVCLYYASNHEYGHAGCVLSGYNTITGQVFYRDNPIDGQQIVSLCYDENRKMLIGGTTYQTDCGVAEEYDDKCYIVHIHPGSFDISKSVHVPFDVKLAVAEGFIDEDSLLLKCAFINDSIRLFKYSIPEQTFEESNLVFASGQLRHLKRTSKKGRFIALIDGSFELWEFGGEAGIKKTVILRDDKVYEIFESMGTLYAVTDRNIYVINPS
ncbi:MAG: hypothetical protein GX541_01365 [Clostridiales bacterium]|nr:hypothetical protein [Clostridiales bacterium]